MNTAPITPDEEARLAALRRYAIRGIEPYNRSAPAVEIRDVLETARPDRPGVSSAA